MACARRLLALVAATFAGLGCASTAREPSTDAARDHLVFAFPNWCAARVAKRPWTEWDAARSREPTGNGVCGVRASDDTEVCVTLQDHRIARLEVAKKGEGRKVLDAPAGDARLGAWEVPAGAEPALVRLRGAALEAEVQGAVERGPCFSW